jgi:3-oxoadipate enol-lactonase
MKLTKPIIRTIFIAGTIGLLSFPIMIRNKEYKNQFKKMKEDSKDVHIQSKIERKELIHNGYSVNYYASGNSKNDMIVFLHPAFADHGAFDQQIDFFAKNYRVITMDLPGHGLATQGKAKIDHSIHHIHSIMESEGYQKAHFVGVSMGSLIAQYFALHFPEKVQSMTVLGGYDINGDNRELNKAQRSENIKWIFKALFSMNSFRRYVASVSVNSPEQQIRIYEMAKKFTRKSFLAMSGLANVVKHREGIIQNHPLLILSGNKDIELAIRMSKKWYHENSSSEFYIIENAGHCANMDEPEVFNRLVMDFIKKGD